MNISKIMDRLGLSSVGKALGLTDRIGKTDRGVLKVAFMVAALDGEVTDDEFAAFDALAMKCRGATRENAKETLLEAMRSAGYLMLISKRATDDELVKVFEGEVLAALPDGFAYFSIEDVRKAFVTWVAMASSDGDYSPRERLCIEALKRLFAEMRVTEQMAEEERWKALSPAFHQAYGEPQTSPCELVTEDFLARVGNVLAAYGDADTAAEGLETLVKQG